MRWVSTPLVRSAVIMLCIAAAITGRSTSTRSVAAFELDVHEHIVREALAGQMSGEALDKVVGHFITGSGNLGSDLHQLAPERHFDNAADGATICARWDAGLNNFLNQAVQNSAPRGDEQRQLRDRDEALSEFGAATHALADFYSHTNWVESYSVPATPGLDVAMPPPPEAPMLSDTCDPAAFPAGLQSGYFDVAYALPGTPGQGTGCPPDGPPPPFIYCHAQLNKDSDAPADAAGQPDHHGSDLAADGVSYHEHAVALATAATRQAWQRLHQRILQAYDNAATDGECLFHKLGYGGDESCRKQYELAFDSTMTLTASPDQSINTVHVQAMVPLQPATDGTAEGEGPLTHISFDIQSPIVRAAGTRDSRLIVRKVSADYAHARDTGDPGVTMTIKFGYPDFPLEMQTLAINGSSAGSQAVELLTFAFDHADELVGVPPPNPNTDVVHGDFSYRIQNWTYVGTDVFARKSYERFTSLGGITFKDKTTIELRRATR